MDDAGPPSLFVVAYHGPYYGDMDPPNINILQLNTRELPPEVDTPEVDTPEVDEIIRFNKEPEDRRPIRWLISPPTSSTEDLYMVPNWGFRNFKPLQGYKFNLRSGKCEPITPPLSSEWAVREGHVVNLGGRIYLLGYYWDRDKHSFFQCYDPDKKSWKSLEPFPQDSAKLGPFVATAVLGDTILFNLVYSNIWAYDVCKNKWYEVGVEDKRCYYIEGEAVVLEDTIYALTDESFNLVVALSVEKKGIDGGDLVLKCSSENLVPGMKPINYQDAWDRDTWRRTRHLVHLGNDNFCLVQSCNLYSRFIDCQDIQVTYIKLKGKNSMILAERVHKVAWQFIEQFDVVVCFSLPKGATTALKEGKIFNLDPFPEAVEEEEDEDNDSSQTNIIDEQGSSSFGPIETDWIQVKSNKEELEQSWASELKAQKDNGGGNESQPIGDPSEAESSEDEEVDKLIAQVMSLKYEVDLLTCASENKTQVEMQLKSTYDMVEPSKSSFSAREAELEPEIQQSRLQIEQLKANPMDEETKLQGIWEEKEELNVELASKGEPDYEKDKLKADLLDKETELRRVEEELKQWKKDAEDAFDMLLSTGNNGKLMDRSVLTGSKYGPRSRRKALTYSDNSIWKKNRNVLKRLGEILWKKPQKNRDVDCPS